MPSSDAIVATGRSDYPNQVNNVLCFPFIFRGALDVGATTINEAMKLATVRALADLTHAEIPDEVASAYGAEGLREAAAQVTPWIAALGMALSSLLVTLNALRLTRMAH